MLAYARDGVREKREREKRERGDRGAREREIKRGEREREVFADARQCVRRNDSDVGVWKSDATTPGPDAARRLG